MSEKLVFTRAHGTVQKYHLTALGLQELTVPGDKHQVTFTSICSGLLGWMVRKRFGLKISFIMLQQCNVFVFKLCHLTFFCLYWYLKPGRSLMRRQTKQFDGTANNWFGVKMPSLLQRITYFTNIFVPLLSHNCVISLWILHFGLWSSRSKGQRCQDSLLAHFGVKIHRSWTLQT